MVRPIPGSFRPSSMPIPPCFRFVPGGAQRTGACRIGFGAHIGAAEQVAETGKYHVGAYLCSTGRQVSPKNRISRDAIFISKSAKIVSNPFSKHTTKVNGRPPVATRFLPKTKTAANPKKVCSGAFWRPWADSNCRPFA